MVPHHLMDYVDASMDVHTVVDFRDEAVPVIDDLLQRGKTPVICGGTMYYIEALLWDVLIPSGGIPHPSHHQGQEEKSGDELARLEGDEGNEEREEKDGEEEDSFDHFGTEIPGRRKKPSKKEIEMMDGLALYEKLKVGLGLFFSLFLSFVVSLFHLLLLHIFF